LGLLFAGCAHHSGGDDDGAGSGAIVGLEITPSAAHVDLAPAMPGYSATQTFAVTATYEDGTTSDVTADATFTEDDTDAVKIDLATATVTAAGHYNITATVDSNTVPATLDASLDDFTLGTGFDPNAQAFLDGTPTAASFAIAYPLAGSLFPENVAPIAIQMAKSDNSQTLARIDFTSGALLAYRYYAPCTASPTTANACVVSITGDFAPQLAGVSETDDVQLTVRLVAPDGSKLAESSPIALAWSKTKLTGGLYYWTTAGTGDTTFNTAIARYDFAGDTSTPQIYLSSADAPAVPQGQSQCIGCHSVSPDGTRMAFSLGGSLPGYFSDYDVAAKRAVSTQMTNFAGMSTFAPDGSSLVTMSYGTLTLRTGDQTLAAMQTPLFPEVTEEKSHPFWSPSGQKLAYVSWNPSQADVQAGHVTGDMVQGGQIWITDVNGTAMGTSTNLIPRAANTTSFYPAISDDDHFVVFNQSDCNGPANTPGGWGAGSCDGYNDISATLHLISTNGGTPVALTNANGGDAPLTTNSWPRWSPDHGTFRGKRLYWVAFSSRRGYGVSLASGASHDTTKPQLWFAAVSVDADGSMPAVDPSFAPVWLPGQDPSFTGPRGNHTPAWTSKVVTIE
jgi:Tol biopolymer transport system component